MKDLDDLMAAWADQAEFPESRRAELLARLREDAGLRRELAEQVQMSGLTRTVQAGEPRWLELEELMEAPAQRPAAVRSLEDSVLDQLQAIPDRVINWRRWFQVGLAFGCVVCAFFLGKSLDGRNGEGAALAEAGEVDVAPVSSPLAVIGQTAGARWADETLPRNSGSMLGRGRIRLEEGMAQVDFFGGAHVILEGPAELELISQSVAVLHSGSARCEVTEHGKGFQLSPPGMNVTDLGTAFGLTVPADGEPELHVLDGKVIVQAPGGPERELNASDAVRLQDLQIRTVDYAPTAFPDQDELTRRARKAMTARSVEWWDQTLKWQHEPETALHYTLVSDVYQQQRIHNQASEADAASHGMVIGGRWAEGRWPWKRALEFRRRGDRVLLGLAGKYPALTIAKWLRVDAFTQERNIILRSKSSLRGTTRIYADAARGAGEIQWDVRRDGTMHFEVTGKGGSSQTLSTPPVLGDNWIGSWVMVGVTYDSKTGEAVHYWNGKAVAREQLRDAGPLTFDFLELGNPHLDTPELRRLNRNGFLGAIDELMVSRRVVAEAEMEEFYEAGKPAS